MATDTTIGKKQNRISDLPNLSPELMENIFNVYQEADTGRYYYNLLQTVVFPQNLPPNFFTKYVIRFGDTWPLVSYRNYKTPNFWWLILLANNINNPIELPEVGTSILIPTVNVAQIVINQISK